MSDRYIEKNFLYLLALSLLFHVAVYLVIMIIPPEQPKTAPEPTMVDLTDLPDLTPQPQPQPPREKPEPKPEIRRYAEKPQRVVKEMAPKGRDEMDRMLPKTRPLPQSSRPAPAQRVPVPPQAAQPTQEPLPPGQGIFKPKTAQVPDRAKLFPSATRMARLEESYREKYRSEVEEGDTRFLNTDDIMFGSFLRRLETAIYGVWHYPQAALVRGIEGTTPVRITFNRRGEIVRVDMLESSGSKILDDEVLRTLNALGPIGSFPKGYTGETFKLIAFFHYGSGSGRLH
ncbi:TonB family protein [Geomonas nitrogeniifigens]|uniref:TonB family protein n=1 Tax=Geomonas diazotrophica TaxID=2843197 RepID=A0ABX8JDJ2_9BACT|nr:TonB family protein [Geomonas nitrogeniifigens]QWV96081.1 TonB family protein [Geomonas nitrogeniifigens]QXE85149.1 TonB family protein [Geomonas nitrogeniifigens]